MIPGKRTLFSLFVIASSFFAASVIGAGQEKLPGPANDQPLSKDQREDKLKLESKAVALLEEVVSGSHVLKLSDNRVRVQIIAADMLWSRDQPRARALFNGAAMAITQMTSHADGENRDRADLAARLRRELVPTVAPHDAELAFQLLRSTRPEANDKRFDLNAETNLEESLLTIIASSDLTTAYRKIVELLDAGEFPAGAESVLRQLYSKDREGFEKLSKKLLSKFTVDSLIAREDADNLAVNLLQPGPIVEGERAADTSSNQTLTESAYRDLMDAAITAALTALPNTKPRSDAIISVGITTSNRDPVMVIGDNAQVGYFLLPVSAMQPDDEGQNNAQRLLSRLQKLLPQIEQYLPNRAPAVRQKLIDVGAGKTDESMAIDLDESTSESLMTAARTAPPQIQPQIYEQAAKKALDEGNFERALGIAKEHLDESGRKTITEAIAFKKMAVNPTPEQLEQIRQKLEALPSNSARVKTLVELAAAAEKANPKLALKFLDDAVDIVRNRADKYQDFADQLSVADAMASLNPKRSFAVLESGIAHLNEILAAAAVVNGFEAEVFREGELPLQGGSELGNMVVRYGSELGSLAKLDFDHAKMSAEKFQLPESRLFVKLLIAQRVLGGKPFSNNGRND
jgi:hypothetical protein